MNFQMQNMPPSVHSELFDFDTLFEEAKDNAIMSGITTEFTYQGIICRVSPDTPNSLLWRDYLIATKLKQPDIGPNCIPNISKEVQEEIKLVKDHPDLIKGEKEKTLGERTKTIELDMAPEYEDWKNSVNTFHGKVLITFAELIGKLLTIQLDTGRIPDVEHCIQEATFDVALKPLTEPALQILKKYWKHGNILK